jgi:hypothetical protein
MKRLAPCLGLLFLLPILAGCSPRTGHVTGKVTYNGNPVPAGWIQFRPADPAQNSVTVELKEDGSFEVDLPAGEVTVTIDNREWEPRAAGAIPSIPAGIPLSPEARAQVAASAAAAKKENEGKAGGRSGKYVRLPEKYLDTASSPLKFTVKGGDQTENLTLTD